MTQNVPNQYLVDSGFLVALTIIDDRFHPRAKAFLEEQVQSDIILLVVDVVLVEVLYFIEKRVGRDAAVSLQENMVGSHITILPVDDTIIQRSTQIRKQYKHFDFVDSCVMAWSERLEIANVLSFDSDFRQFRPRHVDYLRVSP